jgi:hypothetical protein
VKHPQADSHSNHGASAVDLSGFQIGFLAEVQSLAPDRKLGHPLELVEQPAIPDAILVLSDEAPIERPLPQKCRVFISRFGGVAFGCYGITLTTGLKSLRPEEISEARTRPYPINLIAAPGTACDTTAASMTRRAGAFDRSNICGRGQLQAERAERNGLHFTPGLNR